LIKIVIPGAPRGKGRARSRIVRTKEGKQFVSQYTPAQTRSEEGAVRMFAQLAMEGEPPIEGPIELRIAAYFPVPPSWSKKRGAMALRGEIMHVGRPDLDNVVKLVSDGMKAIVWRDDSQVVTLSAWKKYDLLPRVVIEIRRIAPQPVEDTSRHKNEVSQADSTLLSGTGPP
jgi:Holliday junction resolvase RusA-like endonuclease